MKTVIAIIVCLYIELVQGVRSMSDKMFRRKLARIKRRGEQYKRIKELEDVYAEYMPEKKERKVSNIMLVIIVAAIVGYAAVNCWLQYNMGVEISSTLTGCWFSFWGVEIVALAAIKTNKVKHSADCHTCE